MYRNAYLETEVLSASPVQLIEMLYRGAIQALQNAVQAIEGADIVERSRSLTRAQSILTELAQSLNHSQGGKLSEDLAELYDYMQRRLGQANFEQLAGPVREVQALLVTLLEAWTSIASGFGNAGFGNAGGYDPAAAPGFGGSSSSGGSSCGGGSREIRSIARGQISTHHYSSQFGGVDFESPRVDSLG